MYRGLKMPTWGAIVGALGGGAGAGTATGAATTAAATTGTTGAGIAAAPTVASGTGGALMTPATAGSIVGGPTASAANAGQIIGATGQGAEAAAGGGAMGALGQGVSNLYHMADVSKLDAFTDPTTGQFDMGALFSSQRREDYTRMRKALMDIGEPTKSANLVGEAATRTGSTYYGNPDKPEGEQQDDTLRKELMRRMYGV